MRPAKKRFEDIEIGKRILSDYKSILKLKITNKDRLLSVLDELDSLSKERLDELGIVKDAEFIKQWSAAMFVAN